jgi:hypothetical protein
MLPLLARTDGGVVIFTQFLATQGEIASNLARMGTAVRFINGQLRRTSASLSPTRSAAKAAFLC